jgi:hypothetical protein
MTVEVANALWELDETLPDLEDEVKEGDDHIRLIKQLLKETLTPQIYPILDSNTILNPTDYPNPLTIFHITVPIAAERTITLNTTGAKEGQRYRIVRAVASTGAFNVLVGPGIRGLFAGNWIEVVFGGTNWIPIAYGSL